MNTTKTALPRRISRPEPIDICVVHVCQLSIPRPLSRLKSGDRYLADTRMILGIYSTNISDTTISEVRAWCCTRNFGRDHLVFLDSSMQNENSSVR